MYGKLFEHMYDGTLATKGPWQALVTFQQFIILADKRGDVDMTPEAISRRTTIPLEIIRQGIEALEQPDTASRSPALEGRRIVRLSEHREWGWNVVNYGHYRKIRSQDERREYMRLYQRKRRAPVNQEVNTSTTDIQNQPIAVSRKQYAGSRKQEAVKSKTQVAAMPLPDWLDVKAWTEWLKVRKAKSNTPGSLQAALKKLEGFKAAGFDPNEIVSNSLANGWQGLFPPAKAKVSGTPDYSTVIANLRD